tara:strand:- start:2289 stop:2960 length:672 start_codon:yes stop_codon:yes gene_type:complete
MVEEIRADKGLPGKDRDELLGWIDSMLKGAPFFQGKKGTLYNCPSLENCNVSQCYNCSSIAVWVYDRVVYPNSKIEISPNSDLPDYIQKLFNEARGVVDISPRGAAAILRLCIQYLCKELGESGKKIDNDIASLVGKGLNPLVQKALDVVRVIGNDAVHPGEINLDDNKDVAIKLFGLVNLICEQMITHPKQVDILYRSLPEGKLKGIEQRNAKVTKGQSGDQ